MYLWQSSLEEDLGLLLLQPFPPHGCWEVCTTVGEGDLVDANPCLLRINPNCSPDFPAGDRVAPPPAPPTVPGGADCPATRQTDSSLRTSPVPAA